jgi:DNA polymerase-3 subunit chi
MTQIDFYIHAEDKQRTACRLAAKACAQGMRTMVYCPDADSARRFDRLLWTVPPTAFVPHCFPDDPLAAVTPVIVDAEGTDLKHDDVLLNLRSERPPFFGRFRRLIEIVSLDEEDRRGARERFKFYRDRGYDIRTHDLSATRP